MKVLLCFKLTFVYNIPFHYSTSHRSISGWNELSSLACRSQSGSYEQKGFQELMLQSNSGADSLGWFLLWCRFTLSVITCQSSASFSHSLCDPLRGNNIPCRTNNKCQISSFVYEEQRNLPTDSDIEIKYYDINIPMPRIHVSIAIQYYTFASESVQHNAVSCRPERGEFEIGRTKCANNNNNINFKLIIIQIMSFSFAQQVLYNWTRHKPTCNSHFIFICFNLSVCVCVFVWILVISTLYHSPSFSPCLSSTTAMHFAI